MVGNAEHGESLEGARTLLRQAPLVQHHPSRPAIGTVGDPCARQPLVSWPHLATGSVEGPLEVAAPQRRDRAQRGQVGAPDGIASGLGRRRLPTAGRLSGDDAQGPPLPVGQLVEARQLLRLELVFRGVLESFAAAAALVHQLVYCAPSAMAQTSPTFGTADFTAASRPRAIAHADFDRDGWLDVATAGHDGLVVLLNNEGQGFGSRYRSASPGAGAFDLAAGDLNRDDIADLVVAQADGHTVDVHIGNGDGTFAAPLRLPIAGGSPRGVTLVEHDGDGKLDIIATEYATNAWRILYGDGEGAFNRQARFGAIANPQGVLAADFNRDGRPDVAIAGAGINIVAVFFSTSSGGLVQRNVPVRGAVNVLAAGDYNHDGWLDLSAASSSNSEIYTLLGGPSGLTWSVTTTSGSSPRGIVAADVNQDGCLDLMTANRASSTVNVHLGSGSGTFAAAQAVRAGQGSRNLSAGDFDHDGRLDLITVNESAGSAPLLTNTTPFVAPAFRFTRQSFDAHPGFSGPFGLEAGDFDRDGRLDVVTWANGIDVRLAGRPAARVTTAPVNDVVVADINGDGALDLAATDYHGRQVLVFLNRGDGTFARGPQPFAGFVSGIATADFNRANRPPTVSAGRDFTVAYPAVNGYGDDYSIDASGEDPDLHELRYEWRNSAGAVVSREQSFWPQNLRPGRHTFTVTAYDGRGGHASDSMVLTVLPYEEIIFHAYDFPSQGAWRRQHDDTAASGALIRHPNANAPKLAAPLAYPANYIEKTFAADPTQTYKLWLRLKADGNHWSNDSVFVQFEGATDQNGDPVYQIGTTSGLAVNLEECSNCGISGWGWEDDGWGARDLLGSARVRFPNGVGRIRIQTREDGVSIDQVVLSSNRYAATRPGTAKNDTTILVPTVPGEQ